MRRLPYLLAALCAAPSAAAQTPANLEALELARSRECVDVLARLDVLNGTLAPLAARSQRLLAIAQAVALEEGEVADSLNAEDPVEAAVRAWFVEDAALAQRYLAQPDPALQEQRAAAREAIKVTVTEALEAVQAEADQAIESTGDLRTQAGRCSGAVLIRGAVLEACGAASSRVCEAARDSVSQGGAFRFVESAEVLWGLQELRTWTTPGPLSVGPAGQLGGGRTVGTSRTGNVVVTLTFAPLLQERANLAPEAAQQIVALADSLGFGNAHPEIVFVPSLAIRATLPMPLAGESGYLLHFGQPEEADVVWASRTGTGTPLEGVVPLRLSHLTRLQAGEQMMLTAIMEAEDGETDALFAIEITSLNQGPSVGALLGYMANQLPADLVRLAPVGNP